MVGFQARCRLLMGLVLVLLPAGAAFLLPPPAWPISAQRSALATRGKCWQNFQLSHISLLCANGPGADTPEKTSKGGRGSASSAPAELFGLPREEVAQPLGLLLAAQLILFIGVGAVIPTLPLYGKSIGLSSATSGIVIAAPAIALLLGSRAAGQYADVARKPAMVAGMALIAASDLGTAFASSLVPLIIARLGLGAGRIISESGERGMLADIAGRVPSLRGRALAAQQALSALGIAIGAPIGGIVVQTYGPRAAFLCVTAGALVAMGAYILLPETITRPLRKATKAGDGEEGLLPTTNVAGEKEKAGGSWRELLKQKRWRALALCEGGVRFGFAAKLASIPLLAADALPGGAIGAGALLSAAGLSGLVGAPIGGWLTDKAGARFTVVAAGILSAFGLLLIPLALGDGVLWGLRLESFGAGVGGVSGSGLAFAALVILWSVGATAQGPALTALAQEQAPAGAEATAMALPRAAGDAVYIVAPFMLGLVADMAGAKGVDCAVAGVLTLLGVAALVLLGEPGESRARRE